LFAQKSGETLTNRKTKANLSKVHAKPIHFAQYLNTIWRCSVQNVCKDEPHL